MKIRVRMKFHYIHLFFSLILYFIYYKLDTSVKYNTILTVDAYSTKKVCASGIDDTTCHEVHYGEIVIPSNAVVRLKVLREDGEGYFLTFRREYVLLSYLLTYVREIPMKITEEVNEMAHRQYKGYTYAQLGKYTYNCLVEQVEGSDDLDEKISQNYYSYTRGRWCECPGTKIVGDNNTLKRVIVHCSAATRLFYPSSIVAARHCPRISETFYSLYDIGYPPIFRTVVEVKVEMYSYNDIKKAKTTNDLVTFTQKLTLTDSFSEVRLDKFDLWIKLRNEYTGKAGLVNMNAEYLLIPSAPRTELAVKQSDLSQFCGLVSNSPSLLPCDYKAGVCKTVHPCLRHAMLLPKHLFDLNGGTCNKIGVSLHTWRAHGGDRFCYYYPGTCLENQLIDFIGKHYAAISNNKLSPYKLRNLYGSEAQVNFHPRGEKKLKTKKGSIINPKNKTYDGFVMHLNTAMHYHSIDYRYNADHNVEVYFETSGKAIYEIRPKGDGVISHITPPRNCSATQKESDDCAILVHVWNKHKHDTANFSCLIQCLDPTTKAQYPFIQPISKLSAAIDPDKNYVFFFIMRILTNDAFDVTCEAQLLDSSGKKVAEQPFKISGVQSIQVSDKVDEPVASVTINKYEKLETQKEQTAATKPCCGCGFNIFCYAWNLFTCVKCLIATVLSYLGKIAMIAALVLMVPIIIPLLPFILSILFKIFSIPLKICCCCLKIQYKRRKENKEQAKIRKEEKKREQERMKREQERKKKRHSKRSVGSSDESVGRYALYSQHKKKKHTRRHKISGGSHYSGTSLEESTSSASRSPDSRNSYRSNDSNDYNSSGYSGRRSKYTSSS